MRTAKLRQLTPATALLAALIALPAAAERPVLGQPAPDFRLQDQDGNYHSLADYRGGWVVVYFYPKDKSPGCTTQACAFRDDIFEFRALDVTLLGVSLDDVETHQEFADKYSLPFPLLADTDKSAARAYGVLRNFLLFKMASRETFVIDPRGRIARHYPEVDPESHSAELLSDLAELIAAAGEASDS